MSRNIDTPQVGRWESGIAYADWRLDGETVPNMFLFGVTTPVRTTDGIQVMLPYRAQSFTAGQTLVTAAGAVSGVATAQRQSTVGLKSFLLDDDPGTAIEESGDTLLPGPMAGVFSASGFHEHNFNTSPEQPFLISESTATGVGINPNTTHIYQVTWEFTDENGDRVFSLPSPSLEVTLTGDNTAALIGGRLPWPLTTSGEPIDFHVGPVNRIPNISIYRTSYQGGVPTTIHYKITSDLYVNGLAPISTTNASGFSFPDEFTWNYLDENPDVNILASEQLYTDKGFLPRFPCPAFIGGVTAWKNRDWVIGYDGAVWMSGEKTEGDASWFFPGFRYPFPLDDQPTALGAMDDYLIVTCARSCWYIPSADFPGNNGKGGVLPTPVRLPFTNGGTGFAKTLRTGVAYTSTAGGVWLVNRALENKWLSQPIQDSLGEIPVTGLAVDKHQRLHVATGTSLWFVYDQVVETWYLWNLATARAFLPAILEGEAVFEDDNHVWLYSPAIFADMLEDDPQPVAPDVTFASFNFKNVRGVKRLWEAQLCGQWKGPHRLNGVLSYPDDDADNPTTLGPYTPDPDAEYLIAFNPLIEEATSFGLRLFVDFVGVETPGNSAEWELVSCEVGVDSGQGVYKMPDNRRMGQT